LTGIAEHWDEAYRAGASRRSWFQAHAVVSLAMFDRCGVTPADSVIDVGAGASPLVDALIERGHEDVTALDVSAAGLDVARARLGEAAERAHWVVADLLAWQPPRTWQVWHDRAVLHFMTTPSAQRRYLNALQDATRPGALAVIATFAPDGPDHCSGLPVARYGPDAIADLLGRRWRLVAEATEQHRTPGGVVQPFSWAALRRTA